MPVRLNESSTIRSENNSELRRLNRPVSCRSTQVYMMHDCTRTLVQTCALTLFQNSVADRAARMLLTGLFFLYADTVSRSTYLRGLSRWDPMEVDLVVLCSTGGGRRWNDAWACFPSDFDSTRGAKWLLVEGGVTEGRFGCNHQVKRWSLARYGDELSCGSLP